MSRVAQTFNKSIVTVAAVVLIGTGTVVGLVQGHNAIQKAQLTTSQSQTTDVKYHGEDGQNALDLLKKLTTVETKHYSFGDQVISINGTAGNGPKYWSFYVNGKLADVGAGSYVTKNTDQLEWKLQSL